MSFLRFLALAALGLWTGGLVALGVAASAMFGVLEAHDPAMGRELGGLAFGVIFERFLHLSWFLGVALIVSLAFRAALGPRPRRLAVRIWVSVAMLITSVATVLAIVPRINAIRDSTTGAIANLSDQDSRKIEFGRLHGLANGLMCLTVVAGFGLTWAEMRDIN